MRDATLARVTGAWIGAAMAVAVALGGAGAAAAQAEERRWDINVVGFFPKGKLPLLVTARERDGKWLAAVASSQKQFNGSNYYVDMSAVPIAGGKMKGDVTLHMTPDLWIPADHKPFTVVLEVDTTVSAEGELTGTYKVKAVTSTDKATLDKIVSKGGDLRGTGTPTAAPAPVAQVTLNLNMQTALVGGKPNHQERCMMLQLGLDGGKLVSAVAGVMSQKRQMYGQAPFAADAAALAIDDASIRGKLSVPFQTIDLTPARYDFEIDGRMLEGLVVGSYRLTVNVAGDKPEKIIIDGAFDGTAVKGVQVVKADDRPWYVPVKGFVAPKAGEHPRLLFRKGDVDALRKKAGTTEGKAILSRLRRTLNGANGDTLPGEATGPAADDTGAPGAIAKGYTIGHVAGYGLLYQITGEQKYADLGRQAFEKSLAGVHDVDSRYSFRKPNGALRAGPALGWHAVGFDLCYDGWDAATREKIGRAIAEYDEGREGGDAKAVLDLDALTRGTMPPGSNHFGMQVGGAALALLAVTGESFVDPKRIDMLLKASETSMMRNLTEGFGDGGYFAEGDGTGSMSSQIVFASALGAWKNAMGRDYFNAERPNARMMSLKWTYLTVVQNGRPDFWPIRGGYGHNVWARAGKSGAGYFGVGIGAVADEQKPALKWFYEHFLLETDTAIGCLYDTASRDSQYVAAAYVNWPVGLEGRNPAEVLPLCYRDTIHGFVAWRNRWKDGNDVVISVLLKAAHGYMGAGADGALQVRGFGRKFKWGQVAGDVKHWWSSPRGEASVLTTDAGVSTAVDFTGASGADAMLVTTAKADGEQVKVGPATLTILFLTGGTAPKIEVRGDKAVIGKQEVSVKDGNIVLAVTTAK